MTREEAIEVLRKLPVGLMDLRNEQKSDLTEAIEMALAALRGHPMTDKAVDIPFKRLEALKDGSTD